MATPVALCKLYSLRGAPIQSDALVTDRFDRRRGPSFREKEQRREGEEDENMRVVDISMRGGRGKPKARAPEGKGNAWENPRAEASGGEEGGGGCKHASVLAGELLARREGSPGACAVNSGYDRQHTSKTPQSVHNTAFAVKIM